MVYRKRSYRRATRRSLRSKRRPARRLSKHMVRAIKSIAQQPVETKIFPLRGDFSSFLNNAGYISGASWNIRQNIFSEIPRLKNSATKTEISFVGNEIQARGFKWRFHGYVNTAGATPNARFRFTVYHIPGYQSGTSGIFANGSDFNQDYTNVPTWATWNRQTTKIIFQRSFSMNESSTDPGHTVRSFWIPMRKRVIAQADESIALNTTMAQIKGEQYYWVLECFAPTIADLKANIQGSIDTSLYFKDA